MKAYASRLLAALAGALAAGACSLNPQPLPPGDKPDSGFASVGGSGSGGGGSPVNSGGSSGSSGGSDGRTDGGFDGAMPVVEAGGDAELEAGQDARPYDGGEVEAASDGARAD
jgi:hypothetical protein